MPGSFVDDVCDRERPVQQHIRELWPLCRCRGRCMALEIDALSIPARCQIAPESYRDE
jgi:hypothetical protein